MKKSIWLPIVLVLYLAFMAWHGYPEYAAGRMSGLQYFGVIGVTLFVIFLVHLAMRRRERLRREREQDMVRQDNDKKDK